MNIRNVRRVAVFGAGTMGSGIAQVFAAAGYKVVLYDTNPQAFQRATSIIKTNLETLIEHGLVQENLVDAVLDNIQTTLSLEEAAADADIALECIVEKLEVKKELFYSIDKMCPERTIFASNTSYLNIFQVVPPRRLPNTAIAHWFAPAHIIPLVEVVRGDETKIETIQFLTELVKHIGKIPVVLEKYLPGFCINRIQRIIGREIFFLLDNGYITPQELDLAVKASIIPRSMVLGMVQRYDFTGLDLSAMNLENEDYLEAPFDNKPKSLIERVEKGDLGVKTGRGFYDYTGRKYEEVLKERDAQLLKVFNNLKEQIYKTI